MRRMCVWWDRRLVGDLIQDNHGNMRFHYGEEWLADPGAPPLSASLPKATARVCEAALRTILRRASAGGGAAHRGCQDPRRQRQQ